MKKYKEKEVTKKVLVHDETLCDWCGKEVDLDGSITNDQQFELNFQTLSGTGIYLTGEGWEVEDLCLACIKKLKKLLEDSGIKISKVSW